MFTGLIESIGTIASLAESAGGRVVRIRFSLPLAELQLGESIACDGVCLTVTAFDDSGFLVDVSRETLARSTWANRVVGYSVHLERALRVGDRLGGHMVSGHVDGLGRLVAREERGDNLGLRFELPRALLAYVVAKGSIAIDGVSLTVNELEDPCFSINIVPHTITETRLGALRVGDAVNLEVDVIGKYVVRAALLHAAGRGPGAGPDASVQGTDGAGVTLEKLVRGGWV